MKHYIKILCLGVAVMASDVAAQNKACQTPEYQAFDFWLGKWSVSNTLQSNKSLPPASNNISKILNGCVILEEYSTAQGYKGKSLNIYDLQTKQWHQTWTDNTGLLLQLSGNATNKKMELTGKGVAADGAVLHHKITWTANQDGTVRQVWAQRKLPKNLNQQPARNDELQGEASLPSETSSNDLPAWQVVFDGVYQKAAS
ncbi:hypothetical protein [Flocculibacter collagenilyticus]|uniref:hypothetical protein n=1 Tax=Flocculibacter collagenilyticus TaxID=2744479 RepID=UPI0018F75C2E|nr:hypothetical protein [Flocculibacter collagenilyticus]